MGKINVLPVKNKNNIKPKIEKLKVETPLQSLPPTEVRHACECMCLKNIPGYPYRLGYAKRYIDAQNKIRCLSCDCLALDYETV